MASKVFFTRKITPEAVAELYKKLDIELGGEVAIKVHSGEKGNQNFLRAPFWKPVIDMVGGTVVECNTAYEGSRNTTAAHKQTLIDHGWAELFKTEILDAEGPDLELSMPYGKKINKNFVGKGIEKYNSLLCLSHFKGHPMGGYGGAIKQLSIGFASSYGKQYIHGVGVTEDFWDSDHDSFLMSMADAAKSVADFFGGRAAYINVMANMSVDCDCCAVAEDPCIADIGILASLDPVAIDKACLDLVYKTDDKGKGHLIKRIESRNGALTPKTAADIGLGSLEYDLIEV